MMFSPPNDYRLAERGIYTIIRIPEPRLTFALRDRIDNFLIAARQHSLIVGCIKLSLHEFRSLLADPDFVDQYADGCYRGIPLRLVKGDVWI